MYANVEKFSTHRIMTSPPDPVFVLRGANAPVTCVTFLEYTGPGKIQRIAAGTQEGQVFIWDLKVRHFYLYMHLDDGSYNLILY